MRVIVGPVFFYSPRPGCISVMCVFDSPGAAAGHLSDDAGGTRPLEAQIAEARVPFTWRDVPVTMPAMHYAVFPCGARAEARLATPTVSFFISCNLLAAPRSLAAHAAAAVSARLDSGETPILFHIGDQVYCDAACTSACADPRAAKTLYREEWLRAWTAPANAALLARGVHMMVPDDHEVCDMSRFLSARTCPPRSVVDAALQVAGEFMPTATLPPADRLVSIAQGRVLVQTHRTYSVLDPARASFLGEKQEALLVDAAETVRGVLIVAAPTAPVFFSPDLVRASLNAVVTESAFAWHAPQFIGSLAEFLAVLTERRPANAKTFVVAGDMHTMAQTRIRNTHNGAEIMQFVASGIANAARKDSFYMQTLLMNSGRAIAQGKFTYDHLLVRPEINYLVYGPSGFAHVSMSDTGEISTTVC